MTDPLTLATAGTLVLTEAVKFVFKQAGEVLKAWKERKRQAPAPPNPPPATAPLAPAEQSVLAVPVTELHIHYEHAEQLSETLDQLRQRLLNFVEGIEPIDAADQRLVGRVDALRRLLEVVCRRPLTFRGERRSDLGPVLEAAIKANEVLGYVVGISAKKVTAGDLKALIEVGRVEGTIVGIKVDDVGR